MHKTLSFLWEIALNLPLRNQYKLKIINILWIRSVAMDYTLCRVFVLFHSIKNF